MWTRGVTDDNEKVAVGLGDALLNMVLAEESNGPSAGFRVLFSLEFWLELWLEFFRFDDFRDGFLFVISIHSHCYYSFASVSLQFGGL